MQSGERELSFRLTPLALSTITRAHALRSEAAASIAVLADPRFAANNERSAKVSELTDDRIQPRELLVPARAVRADRCSLTELDSLSAIDGQRLRISRIRPDPTAATDGLP